VRSALEAVGRLPPQVTLLDTSALLAEAIALGRGGR
jgi:hypothetical protein